MCFPFCLLSGHGNFMVLHCNSSRGLQRTWTCTTFVGVNRNLDSDPWISKRPLKHLLKVCWGWSQLCSKGETCVPDSSCRSWCHVELWHQMCQMYTKSMWRWWTGEHKQEGGQNRVAGGYHWACGCLSNCYDSDWYLYHFNYGRALKEWWWCL